MDLGTVPPYPRRRFWENLPSCRSLVPAPRKLGSDIRLAFDKYMPTSAERSVGARRGLKNPLQPLTIMRIQLVMRGGIELESPERCNRAFGPGQSPAPPIAVADR